MRSFLILTCMLIGCSQNTDSRPATKNSEKNLPLVSPSSVATSSHDEGMESPIDDLPRRDYHWMHIILIKHDASEKTPYMLIECVEQQKDGTWKRKSTELLKTYVSSSGHIDTPSSFTGVLKIYKDGSLAYLEKLQEIKFTKLKNPPSMKSSKWEAWMTEKPDSSCEKRDRHSLFATYEWWKFIDKKPWMTFTKQEEPKEKDLIGGQDHLLEKLLESGK